MWQRLNNNPLALVALYGAGLYSALAGLDLLSAWSW